MNFFRENEIQNGLFQQAYKRITAVSSKRENEIIKMAESRHYTGI